MAPSVGQLELQVSPPGHRMTDSRELLLRAKVALRGGEASPRTDKRKKLRSNVGLQKDP